MDRCKVPTGETPIGGAWSIVAIVFGARIRNVIVAVFRTQCVLHYLVAGHSAYDGQEKSSKRYILKADRYKCLNIRAKSI